MELQNMGSPIIQKMISPYVYGGFCAEEFALG